MSTTRSAVFVAWFLGSLVVVGAGLSLSSRQISLSNNNLRNGLAVNSSNPDDPVPLMDPNSCLVSSKYPTDILQWCAQISRQAESSALPADLIAAVMLVESGGNPLARSRNGAVGLLQVMPRDGPAAEFQCLNGPCFATRPSSAELEAPDFNLAYGTRLLAALLEHYGEPREALLHYGPIEVGYEYADTVLAVWRKYQ